MKIVLVVILPIVVVHNVVVILLVSVTHYKQVMTPVEQKHLEDQIGTDLPVQTVNRLTGFASPCNKAFSACTHGCAWGRHAMNGRHHGVCD